MLLARKVPFAFAMRIISNVRCATDVSAHSGQRRGHWNLAPLLLLAIPDGAITLGVSLHEDMTKLISVRGRTLQLEHRLLNHL